MIKTKERQEHFNFSNDYLNSPLVIATKIKEPFINSIENVLDKRFGVFNGYAFKDIFIKKYPGIKIITVDNIEDGLSRVETGELFGFIDSLPAIGYSIQKKTCWKFKGHG